jgi:hypothetical protein
MNNGSSGQQEPSGAPSSDSPIEGGTESSAGGELDDSSEAGTDDSSGSVDPADSGTPSPGEDAEATPEATEGGTTQSFEPVAQEVCDRGYAPEAKTCSSDADCVIASIFVSCGVWASGLNQAHAHCADEYMMITDVECFDSESYTDDEREIPQDPEVPFTLSVACVEQACTSSVDFFQCEAEVCSPEQSCVDFMDYEGEIASTSPATLLRTCADGRCDPERGCSCLADTCEAAGYTCQDTAPSTTRTIPAFCARVVE